MPEYAITATLHTDAENPADAAEYFEQRIADRHTVVTVTDEDTGAVFDEDTGAVFEVDGSGNVEPVTSVPAQPEQPGLSGRIEFTGATLADVEAAITEALVRIRAGNTSGFDRNSDGSFTFEVNGEEVDGDAELSEGDAAVYERISLALHTDGDDGTVAE